MAPRSSSRRSLAALTSLPIVLTLPLAGDPRSSSASSSRALDAPSTAVTLAAYNVPSVQGAKTRAPFRGVGRSGRPSAARSSLRMASRSAPSSRRSTSLRNASTSVSAKASGNSGTLPPATAAAASRSFRAAASAPRRCRAAGPAAGAPAPRPSTPSRPGVSLLFFFFDPPARQVGDALRRRFRALRRRAAPDWF